MAEFLGRQFINHSTDCYCNSCINGLLASKRICQAITAQHCTICKFLVRIRDSDPAAAAQESTELREWAAVRNSEFRYGRQNDPQEFLQFLIEHCTILHKLTKMEVQIKYECRICHKITPRMDERHFLFENITSSSMQEIILETHREFIKKECYFCERSQYHEKTEKIMVLPEGLIVYLKRFPRSLYGRSTRKIDTPAPSRISQNTTVSKVR